MRGLIAIGAGIVVVSIVSIVVVAVAGNRQPAAFPADSPEAVLQGYLEAFDAGYDEAAYASFSTKAQATMSAAQYETAAREYRMYRTESYRVTFDGTDGTTDRVTVRVTIEYSSGGGLITNTYGYQTTVPMVREDGTWRIDQALVFLDPAPLPEAAPGTK